MLRTLWTMPLLLLLALGVAGCLGEMGTESTDRLPFDPSDLTPPRIRLLSPAPDTYVEGGSVTITGHVEDDESEPTVTYAGAAVPVGRDGSFTWTGPVPPGAHRFRFEAHDRGDHVATAWTAIVAGDLAPLSTPVDQALAASASAEALDEVARGAGALLTAQSFNGQLQAANPVYDSWPLEVEVREETHGAIAVTVDPLDGAVHASVRINYLRVGFHIGVDILPDADGALTFDAVTVDATVALACTADGRVEGTVASTSLGIEGFGFDIDHVPDAVESIDAIRSAVQRQVESGLSGAISGALPDLVASGLASVPTDHTLPLLGAEVALHTPFHALTLTPEGIAASIDLSASVEAMLPERRDAQYVVVGSGGGPPAITADVGVAMSIDAVNALLTAAWAGAAFDQRIDSIPFGADHLTVRQIALFFPGLGDRASLDAPVAVRIEAALPPVAMLEDAGARLDCADLRVTLVAVEGAAETELLSLSVGVGAALSPEIGPAGDLVLRIGEVGIAADLVGPASDGFPSGAALDELVGDLIRPELASFLGGETGAMGETAIALPSLFGFHFDPSRIAGADGYLVLEGAIRYEMP